jgi:hypothetical protein
MRGIDYMSASSKKKLRKEQEAAALTEKQLAEKKEAKKLRIYTTIFAVVMALVLVIGVGSIIFNGITNSGIIERNTNALTVNGHKINSAEMGYYYIDSLNGFIHNAEEQFGESASLYIQYVYGLDLTKPLDEQQYQGDANMTWGDYFVDAACESAKNVYSMCDAAEKAGHSLSAEEKALIDSAIKNLELTATLRNYPSTKDYLKAQYGHGATVESYKNYVEMSMLAESYYNAYADTLDYDDAAIRAYEKDHYNEFSSFSFSYYTLPADKFLTGGTKNEDGTTTYTDEEKAAALEAAKAAADSLLAFPDAKLFDKAVKSLEINKENKNATIVTVENAFYTDAKIPTLIRDWMCDGEHEQGEMTVLPITNTTTDAEGKETTTTTGYYVVLFDNIRANNSKIANVRHILVSFEGGTKGEDGTTTYSEEEKNTARTEAERILQLWKDGEATEESFAALVPANSDDQGSLTTGGLYENITVDSNYVENFLNWAMEPRKDGDTGIVETEYGYHIMYYVSTNDLSYRDTMIFNTLATNDLTAWYEAILEAATMTKGNLSQLPTDLVLSSTHSH